MTPSLPTLTPLAPAPDGDLRLGRGVAALDGAAAFATLLSGALLHPLAAEGETDVPAESAFSAETDGTDLSIETADRASAAVALPLVAATPPIAAAASGGTPPTATHPLNSDQPTPTLPIPSAHALPTAAPPSAATAAEQAPTPSAAPDSAADAPVLAHGGEAPRDLQDATVADIKTTRLPNEGVALPDETSAEEPHATPRPLPSLASGSEAATPVGSGPATLALADSALSPTTAYEPASDASAPSVEPETPASEPAPAPEPLASATAHETTAPPIDSGETAQELAGDDASEESTAPSADDAKPAAQQQDGSFEGDGQSPQDHAPAEPVPLADYAAPPPDQAEAEAPIPAMSEAADGPAPTARAETPPSLQRTLPVAWLRAVLDQPLRGLTPGAAWQSLQINLDDGEGTLTIHTRRDDDRVSVSVAFSDGHLRGLASASAERIQAVLQEHFGASVDLSLTSDGSGDAPPDGRDDGNAPRSAPRSDLASASRSASPSSPRARLSGSRHEWVG